MVIDQVSSKKVCEFLEVINTP